MHQYYAKGENMTKVQEKWRESLINIEDIDFKNIDFKKIISYPPAGNDVFECIGTYQNKDINFIVKSERGKFAFFDNEINILNKIENDFKVPHVIESGKVNDHTYIVLSKIEGEKLSDIFKEQENISKEKYLYNYGVELAKVHNYSINWIKAKLRDINDYPKIELYKEFDNWEESIVDYLKMTKPSKIEYNTFIHGDFHYGNILWNNYEVTGILDWEYSGMGFKEQDIAWALILRPGQKFMDDINDYESFLDGYKSLGSYNEDNLKWCLINGLMHFYLMNKTKDDKEYLEKIKKLISKLK